MSAAGDALRHPAPAATVAPVAPVAPVATIAPAVPRVRRARRRSAGVRFAVVYALLLGLSALALALFLWWQTAGLLERQTTTAIEKDAEDLHEVFFLAGIPGLRQAIDDRVNQNVDDDVSYLLTDARLQPIAGNLRGWPAGLPQQSGWSGLTVDRAGTRSPASVLQVELTGGFHLLIGRDVMLRAKLGNMLTHALLWALLVVAAMATAGALLVRSLFRRALADVSDTATAIAAGDLTRRVRLSGRGDELDGLAETINDMLDRIARLMDGVRQVSNAIAHDLRTPIARARTRLEDATMHAQGEAELRAVIERATSDLDGITAVFQALLRIAEIEAGSRRVAFAPLDLAPLLRDLAELYAAAAEDQAVRLDLDVPPSLPVYGDPQLIQQAVANLLDNAVKFSPPQGVIRLSGSTGGIGVVITVADQGPGIPAAERAHATERFFRGEAARHTPGSGLGLALVHAVAHLHGGTLSLLDQGPGLRAVLALPSGEPGRTADGPGIGAGIGAGIGIGAAHELSPLS